MMNRLTFMTLLVFSIGTAVTADTASHSQKVSATTESTSVIKDSSAKRIAALLAGAAMWASCASKENSYLSAATAGIAGIMLIKSARFFDSNNRLLTTESYAKVMTNFVKTFGSFWAARDLPRAIGLSKESSLVFTCAFMPVVKKFISSFFSDFADLQAGAIKAATIRS